MPESPTLYVELAASKPGVASYRKASRSEILSAARAHLDYKAAKRAYGDAPVPIRAEDFVRRIVNAALGLTEEGDNE